MSAADFERYRRVVYLLTELQHELNKESHEMTAVTITRYGGAAVTERTVFVGGHGATRVTLPVMLWDAADVAMPKVPL